MNTLRFAHLSDLHLYKYKDFMYHEHHPYQSFCNVVDLLKQEDTLDFILITGDIAAKQEKESYFHVDELLAPLGTPYYWLPGNHDSAVLMKRIAPKVQVQNTNVFETKGTRFILLDSTDRQEKAVAGFLPDDELRFLEKSLAEATNTSTIIALHHQLLATPGSWTNNLGVTNKNDFYKIIDACPQVQAVICGHIHHAHAWQRKGVQYFSAPATSYQFNPYAPEFALDELAPGYQVLSIHPKTRRVHCEVKRI
ncbi:metallophosphoesterase [Microscilla marina]|uniref:Metallophosphoesterase n=1 Tax=Microscilla marina ATCC 23134 TaxID=313606 RepID=A1ZTZ2_MICM2|nr:metallophosphoesterase [Microscilla marina]EAY26105.1 metallophosphoesterase [Microscilla marina ATCC 23134]